MSDATDAVAEELASIAETLADLALDRLRTASESVHSGEGPDPALVAEERRITRARRSVEKAVQLLAGPASAGE
ncbi:MAG: hypothetical protein ACLQOZ_12740 [Acidimicrobiales bacterium]|jgi:hypothetical protein